ncbi:hypothetical protein [uncultured Aquimarina sp.]|uniref:hypothetical protein n=1 Tax=uncultured Aquimarina sp. TaxID=575652 RepID=UPI00261220F9|nr:hypothetical protein [uncultured Aquimarina sp.]
MRQIKVKELETLFRRVIQKLESENIKEIDLDEDFYRFIPTDNWNSYEDIIIDGSLFDDWDSMQMHITNSEEFFPYINLDRIASILRYISEKENPVDE